MSFVIMFVNCSLMSPLSFRYLLECSNLFVQFEHKCIVCHVTLPRDTVNILIAYDITIL